MATTATVRRSVAESGVTKPEPRASVIAFRSEPSVVTTLHLLARARAASIGEIMREALVAWLLEHFDRLDPVLQPDIELAIAALRSNRSLARRRRA